MELEPGQESAVLVGVVTRKMDLYPMPRQADGAEAKIIEHRQRDAPVPLRIDGANLIAVDTEVRVVDSAW